MTKPIPEPEEAAKRLLQEAHQRGSADNITVVVVRFLANKGESSSNTGSSGFSKGPIASSSSLLHGEGPKEASRTSGTSFHQKM